MDIFLLFNFKSKASLCPKVDLMKLLNYCQYHLSSEGYLVYGDFFERGEEKSLQLFFQSFGLRVADQEDISKNIHYAHKLANKEGSECELPLLGRAKKNVFKYLGR